MDHDFMALHGSGQRLNVLHVPAHHAEPRISQVLRIVPLPAGGEVVIQSHRGDGAVRQQLVGKVAADEPSAADDEVACRVHFAISERTWTEFGAWVSGSVRTD